MATLDTYRVSVQRLLHDTSAQYYTTAQLTDYINEARRKVAIDANCVKLLQNLPLQVNVELYPFSSFPNPNTINVLGMGSSVIYGDLKYPLTRKSFAWITAFARAYLSWTDYPQVFCIYGENNLYVAPKPNQAYATELNTAVLPADLTAADPADAQIPAAWAIPVPYYAASLAKLYSQKWQEANLLEDQYKAKLRDVRSGLTGPMGNIYTARS